MAEKEKDDKKGGDNKASAFKILREQQIIERSQSTSLNRIESLLSSNLVHMQKIGKAEKKGLAGSGVAKAKDYLRTDDTDPKANLRVLKDIRSILGGEDKKSMKGYTGAIIGGIIKAAPLLVAVFGKQVSKGLEKYLGAGNPISGAINLLTDFFRFFFIKQLILRLSPILLKSALGGMGKSQCCGGGYDTGGPMRDSKGKKPRSSRPRSRMGGTWGKIAALVGGTAAAAGIYSMMDDGDGDSSTAAALAMGGGAAVGLGMDAVNSVNMAKDAKQTKEMVKSTKTLKTIETEIRNVGKKKLSRKARKEATEKAQKKALEKTVEKSVAKTAGKTAGKSIAKLALKRIPVIGLLAGAAFAVDRAMDGDFVGAGLEMASGAASLLDLAAPGAGLAVGLGLEATIAARDMGVFDPNNPVKENEAYSPEQKKVDDTFLETQGIKNAANKVYLERSMKTISGLHPDMQSRAMAFLSKSYKAGYQPIIKEGVRGAARQQMLKDKGFSKAGPGQSFHNYGMAIDFIFPGKQPYGEQHPWAEVGNIGKSVGLTWGGDWKSFTDRPHLQLGSDYRTLRDKPDKYPLMAEHGLFTNIPSIFGEAGPEFAIPFNNEGIGYLSDAISQALKRMVPSSNQQNIPSINMAAMENKKNKDKRELFTFLAGTFTKTLAEEIAQKTKDTISKVNSNKSTQAANPNIS
tara:strand:+ start:7729 stop:9792 length:2064 start_codon:yes stop_codon:yes gene_type:complete